jgi:hypothetical protein
MDTQTLQVFSLRGMDERWIVDPQDALYIQDMTWTQNDSWRTSGGFLQLFTPKAFEKEEDTSQTQVAGSDDGENTSSSDSATTDSPRFGTINSIHWFAQHNGARQWLIYEEQNSKFNSTTGKLEPDGTVSLKVFDGTLGKRFTNDAVPADAEVKPFRTLVQYEDINFVRSSGPRLSELNIRSESQLATRTQSQSYGGRIYLVNGYDEPLVFDGDLCERAGFSQKPPPPITQTSGYDNSTTFPFAVGTWDQGLVIGQSLTMSDDEEDDETAYPYSARDFKGKGPKLGFYSFHKNVPYWGVGVTSDAEIGAGGYRFDQDDEARHENLFPTPIWLRWSFYALEQINTRRCGFQYKVTYVNERGQESQASEASNIAYVDNGSGGKKRAAHGKGLIGVSLPIGPKECVARRIYRTRNVYDSKGDLFSKGDQRTFYFLKEIPDNMTKIIVDGHPDTALGELLETRDLGNFPPRTKFLAVFKNTMFAAGDDLNELRYSAPLFPEVFPEDHILTIGDDDGGPITGMRATKNALVVFKTRGIYLVKGDPLNGFSAQTLNKDIGCIAPDSITELPGLGLAFLSEKSVYLLEGALENTGSITSVVNIGAEIPNQLERLNTSSAIRASAAVYQKDKEYWLSIPTIGSSKNNICLIYHYEVGSWSIRKDFPIDCMVVSKDHRGYLFMGSNDSENDYRSGILVYTKGVDTKGLTTLERYTDGSVKETSTVPINSIYETVSNDYQSVFSNFRPAHVMAYAVGYGNNGLNVNTRVNRSIDQVRTTVQTAEQQDPNETYPVYGSAKFSTDRWIAYRPTVVRYDISTTHRGPVRELSVSFASTNGNKIELIGYDLEAKVGEQRSIKPLNKALRPSRR